MKKTVTLFLLFLWFGSTVALADFKYTESAKVTGGMMSGALKIAGAFSKQAREPMESTISIKGNRMRTDQPGGNVQIIDLDGRRIINIDTQKHTYSVVTFDQMREAVERARERAERQAHKGKQENVKVTPKIQVTPTDNTKVLLNQTTHEIKVRLDMEVESEDTNQKQQTSSFWMSADAWVAPSIAGSEEAQQFNEKMANELNWAPGNAFGGNPQMADAMAEFRKNASSLKGFPLLEYTSFGIGGMPQGGTTTSGGQGQAETTTTTGQTGGGGATSSSSGGILGGFGKKGIGGMLGGFGKKKKTQETTSTDNTGGTSGGQTATSSSSGGEGSTTTGGSAATGNSASLMDMTVEVTSYSNDTLDSSVFDIPADYTEVQADADKIVQGRR